MANNIKRVFADEFYKIYTENIEKPDYDIIDIRTPMEYQMGHIPKSKNIDLYNPNFKEELNKLDKNKTYLIYCRSGNRTSYVLNLMYELGFNNIIELAEGLISWVPKGYEIEK